MLSYLITATLNLVKLSKMFLFVTELDLTALINSHYYAHAYVADIIYEIDNVCTNLSLYKYYI